MAVIPQTTLYDLLFLEHPKLSVHSTFLLLDTPFQVNESRAGRARRQVLQRGYSQIFPHCLFGLRRVQALILRIVPAIFLLRLPSWPPNARGYARLY